MTKQKKALAEDGPEPTTVTIDRAVFLDVAGSAFAAYMIAQWNYMILVRRGIITADEGLKGLADLVAIAKQSGQLAGLAIPRITIEQTDRCSG